MSEVRVTLTIDCSLDMILSLLFSSVCFRVTAVFDVSCSCNVEWHAILNATT